MEKRTKLVDKKTYIKWYNLAKEEIKDENLTPPRNEQEIFDLVSEENWLIFCLKDETKEMAIQKEDPNIFLDILSKEGNLTGRARLGLTFNNIKSYEKFKTIMKGYNTEIKEKITNRLLNLKKSWHMNIKRKIKKNHNLQTPDYYSEGDWNSNAINEDIIDEIIKLGEKIKIEGRENRNKIRLETGRPKKYYIELPSINLMDEEFPLTEEEFKKRILEIFEVLSLCLNVKTEIKAKREIKELESKINHTEEELNNKKDFLRSNEFLGKTMKREESLLKLPEIEKDIKETEEELKTLKDELKKYSE